MHISSQDTARVAVRRGIGTLGIRMPRAEDFPGGAVAENPPANAGDTGSSPGPGRSRMPRSN